MKEGRKTEGRTNRKLLADGVLAFVVKMPFRESGTESNTVKSDIHDSC